MPKPYQRKGRKLKVCANPERTLPMITWLYRNQTEFYNYARYLTTSYDRALSADDLVQDTAFKLWRMAPVLEQNKWRPYIYTTLHNVAKDILRKKKQPDLLPEHWDMAVSAFREEECSDEVRVVLDLLTENQRTVLMLHYLQEVELSEIATRLDIPMGTVKSRFAAGRLRFQTLWTRLYGPAAHNLPAMAKAG